MKKLRLGRFALPLYSVIALVYLLIPIVYTIAFSFNNSQGRTNTIWQGFTLDKWMNVCARPDVCASVGTSLLISTVSTLVATVLGTAVAIALVRYSFRGRSLVSLSLFLPMATPEVVMGAGLAALFFNLNFGQGYLTVILAHIMFCLSFVVVTVKARVQTLDPVLEEAGADLYASPRQVFWRITFPLLLPGIVSGALLSFVLSFDDFIITYFNAGGALVTFPMFIYVAAAKGVPAEVNVIASMVFLLALVIVIGTQVASNIRQKRLNTLN